MGQWTLAAVAGSVLCFAAISRRLESSIVSAAMFFVSAGLVLGTDGLKWIDLPVDSHVMRLLAEIALSLLLFADASRIDLLAMRREYVLPARLLGIGLPLTILVGWALAAVVFGSLSWTEALILAVILAPTDAALGESVVTDSRLPSRIRQSLNVESGLNDGICVPLLFIALASAAAEDGSSSVAHSVKLVAEEIGYGVVGGAAAGAAAALLLMLAVRRRLISESWFQIVPVGAAGLAYGLAAPLGGSGFIAAFVAGFVFGALVRETGGESTHLIYEVGELASGLTFLVFGASIVAPVLSNVTWAAVGYAILSLTVARMLPVALSMIGMHPRAPTIAFVGWFGPRGLASIVFVVLTVEGSNLPHANTIVLAVVTTIVMSVYAHGISARPLTDRYVGWWSKHPRESLPGMEATPAHHQRWRRPTGPRGAQP